MALLKIYDGMGWNSTGMESTGVWRGHCGLSSVRIMHAALDLPLNFLGHRHMKYVEVSRAGDE